MDTLFLLFSFTCITMYARNIWVHNKLVDGKNPNDKRHQKENVTQTRHPYRSEARHIIRWHCHNQRSNGHEQHTEQDQKKEFDLVWQVMLSEL